MTLLKDIIVRLSNYKPSPSKAIFSEKVGLHGQKSDLEPNL